MRTFLAVMLLVVFSLPCSTSAGSLCLAPRSVSGQYEFDYCGTPLAPSFEWSGFATVEAELCLTDLQTCPPVEWYPGYGGVGMALSRSMWDPNDNVGPLDPVDPVVYLWLLCTPVGVELAGARFSVSGDLEVATYTPMNGTGNSGVLPELDLDIPPCAGGPLPLGAFELSGTVAVEKSGWGRLKADYR